MQEVNFEEVVDQIVARDGRYRRDAYLFLRDGLDYTQKQVAREDKGRLRHVTGQELAEGLRAYAIQEFGPMALTVLNEWGLQRTADFGELVFNMVEVGLLAKTDQDSRGDFADVYSFEDAFRKPFVPRSKRVGDFRPQPKSAEA